MGFAPLPEECWSELLLVRSEEGEQKHDPFVPRAAPIWLVLLELERLEPGWLEPWLPALVLLEVAQPEFHVGSARSRLRASLKALGHKSNFAGIGVPKVQ